MQKILVIATRQIGDVLLTTPLIHAARQQWPKAEIDVIGLAGTMGMLKGNPDVHSLISTHPDKGWRDTLKVLRAVWKNYDLALVTQPSDRAHLIGWAASSRYRSGIIPQKNSSNWWKKRILNYVVVSDGDEGTTHVVMEKLALLAPWSMPKMANAQVQAPPPQSLPPTLDSLITPNAIVVHAPSMWPYKQWPLTHFRQLLQQLIQAGHQIVLTGSASPADQNGIKQLTDIAPSPQLIDSSGQLNFNQLVNLFGRTRLYIGPDTSVTHLAAASGIPVLALFGPTNPLRWGPWPSTKSVQQVYVQHALEQTVHNITLLQGEISCVPCSKAGCENRTQSRSDCLAGMLPDRVFQIAQEIYSRIQRPNIFLKKIAINNHLHSAPARQLGKILISYHAFPPIADDLAEAFERKGIQAKLFITSNYEHWFHKKIIKKINKIARNLRIIKKGVDLFKRNHLNKVNYLESNFQKKFEEVKPDLLLFIHGQPYGNRFLEKITIPKIAWWVEPHTNADELKEYSKPFDIYASYNKKSMAEISLFGRKTTYLHHAVNPRSFYPKSEIQKIYDVTFVGNWSPWREQVIEQVLKTTTKIALYGPMWRRKCSIPKKDFLKIYKDEQIIGAELNDLFNSSKIVLNAQRITDGNGLNMRFFEVPATATCYLTDEAEELKDHFITGKQLCVFNDLKDLKKQLENLLEDASLRDSIRWAGYKHVLENYTYDHMANNLLKMYEEIIDNQVNSTSYFH